MSFHVPEQARITTGRHGSDASYGNNGAFWVMLKRAQKVFVIASDWDHVSVSRQDRVPTWDEMCQIKALFWDGNDCVIQFHPPESDYINNHPNCLHLWRSTAQEMPRPPKWMVGL